ncbi:Uma2 family endonuclease [Allorhizocola rhizosphaerae]|uniref:Uma2 family endonuclease n=1 Tax=Allorhizocola rhizosphaerae TaxID=1872709 RepID=UPI0013C32A29|nr:Uma2 family endonuclease [Allorhizocola rhizosphaerae]
MTQTAVRPMHEAWTHDHWTEEELAKLPQDHGNRYEIIDGRLYVTPPAGELHNAPGARLIALLLTAAPPGWRVLYEIGLRIGKHLLIPDLVVLPPGTPTADKGYNDVKVVQPALVIEIASASTETIDKGTKMVAYATGGIPSYWRMTREGVLHLHHLVTDGQYGLLATVRPGEEYKAIVPFPVVLEPSKLGA